MIGKQSSGAIKSNLVALTAVALVATCFGQAYPPRSPDLASLSNLAYLDTSGSASSVIPFGRDINNVIPRIAQGFRTGANPDGYLVSSVTLAFHDAIGRPTGFTLNLFKESSGQPSTSIGLLSGDPNPDRSGNYSYSAPSLLLQPNTLYFLVLEGSGTLLVENDQYLWYRANTTAVDSNDGWQIAGIWYSLNGGAWTYWGGYPPGALEITARSLIVDSDGDGVPDSQDKCPNTSAGEIVDADGCSIDQLVPCAGPRQGDAWRNHGEYVSAVAKVVGTFLGRALITQGQASQITAAAARSDCGRNRQRGGDVLRPLEPGAATRPNKADAPNPAMTPLFHAGPADAGSVICGVRQNNEK